MKRKKYLEKTKDAIQCDYCTKLFNHKSNLKYHINKFHPDEVNRFDDEKEQVKLFDFLKKIFLKIYNFEKQKYLKNRLKIKLQLKIFFCKDF